MRIITLCLLALTGLCVTGCNLIGENDYKAVNYYDLGTPQNQSLPNVTVKFATFRALEAAKYKMVYHTARSRVLIDEYNKWVQTPGFMLNRYLQFAFCQPPGTAACGIDQIYEVTGTLFTFKIDLGKNKTVLGVSYIIRRSGSDSLAPLVERSVRYTADFKNHDGLDFARAMTKTAEQLAHDIRNDIKQLEKDK